MVVLAPRERLQPSLLDRLRDDEPDQKIESRDHRVLSLRTLRQGVLRDLTWLLNTTNLLPARSAKNLPYLSGSVLNYGIPDTSGLSVGSLNISQLERGIRQAIWDFEPRLIRASVSVKAAAIDGHDHNKLIFEIEADLWAQPYPERLYLKTELDLGNDVVFVTENNVRSNV
jgi:type VI secretion system protein ImpF